MTRLNIKPKAAAIWSEQTEKLKQKIAGLIGSDLYFEQSKLDEMMIRVHGSRPEEPRMKLIKHYSQENPYQW